MSADSRLEAQAWRHVYEGKVRDLYRSPGHPGRILVVASDRVSAFDYLLEPGIPGKGAMLTQLSLWWFERLSIPNHLAAAHPALGERLPDGVAERAMLVRELDMLPVECVVRGYLVGSGWIEYRATQSVCGVRLPPGLDEGDRLPHPIYTPAWKAPRGQHDENISFDRTVELVGADAATQLRDRSLEVYSTGASLAAEHGLVLADTKFEFGRDPSSGEIVIADEVLTPDSSRFWDAERYAEGGPGRTSSFDKQIVRDWLAANWDRSGVPPELPPEIVELTAARYRELVGRLRG